MEFNVYNNDGNVYKSIVEGESFIDALLGRNTIVSSGNVNNVKAFNARLDVLTSENLKGKIPAKYSGNSRLRKLSSLTKSLKEARADFQRINEEHRKQREEARRAYLEIEKAHEKVFKKAVKVSDAPKKVDFRYKAMTKKADQAAEKMFRGRGN